MRAARAALEFDWCEFAHLSALSFRIIGRLGASDHVIRGNVDPLMKLVGASSADCEELIGGGVSGGHGVRLARV